MESVSRLTPLAVRESAQFKLMALLMDGYMHADRILHVHSAVCAFQFFLTPGIDPMNILLCADRKPLSFSARRLHKTTSKVIRMSVFSCRNKDRSKSSQGYPFAGEKADDATLAPAADGSLSTAQNFPIVFTASLNCWKSTGLTT
jgi:hypothetical protein